jgi:hypothetical protein
MWCKNVEEQGKWLRPIKKPQVWKTPAAIKSRKLEAMEPQEGVFQ